MHWQALLLLASSAATAVPSKLQLYDVVAASSVNEKVLKPLMTDAVRDVNAMGVLPEPKQD